MGSNMLARPPPLAAFVPSALHASSTGHILPGHSRPPANISPINASASHPPLFTHRRTSQPQAKQWPSSFFSSSSPPPSSSHSPPKHASATETTPKSGWSDACRTAAGILPSCVQDCQRQYEREKEQQGGGGDRSRKNVAEGESGREEEGGKERENPYFFGEDSFRDRYRTEEGSFQILERFATNTDVLMGIESYRLGIFTVNPLAYVLPHHCHADATFYVSRGRGTIVLLRENNRDSNNVEEGDILLVKAGTFILIANTDERKQLQIVNYLDPAATPGEVEEYFVAGGEDPESILGSFSKELSQAAFKISGGQLERLTGKHNKGPVLKGSKEQMKALRRQSKRHFNLLDQRPNLSNEYGQLFEANERDYEGLGHSDLSFAFINLTKACKEQRNSRITTQSLQRWLWCCKEGVTLRWFALTYQLPRERQREERGSHEGEGEEGQGQEKEGGYGQGEEGEEGEEEEGEEGKGQEKEGGRGQGGGGGEEGKGQEEEGGRGQGGEGEGEEEEGQGQEKEGGGGQGGEGEDNERGEGRIRYETVRSDLSPNTVYVAPPGHPVITVASGDENLQILLIHIYSRGNRRHYFAGRQNLQRKLEKEEMELSFGAPSEEVRKILRAQNDEGFTQGPE
ncbi:hypothetical protein ACLOJK_019805 [Asimina triloba]